MKESLCLRFNDAPVLWLVVQELAKLQLSALSKMLPGNAALYLLSVLGSFHSLPLWTIFPSGWVPASKVFQLGERNDIAFHTYAFTYWIHSTQKSIECANFPQQFSDNSLMYSTFVHYSAGLISEKCENRRLKTGLYWPTSAICTSFQLLPCILLEKLMKNRK